jgi:hypothetical protein
MGADSEILKAAYEFDSKADRQIRAYASPEPVTANNFYDHVGEEDFYNAYLRFFNDLIVVQKKDVRAVLDEFVFSDRSPSGKNPQLLSRFFGGLIHSLIHVGYGLEFGLPGMIVEGKKQYLLAIFTRINFMSRSSAFRHPQPYSWFRYFCSAFRSYW